MVAILKNRKLEVVGLYHRNQTLGSRRAKTEENELKARLFLQQFMRLLHNLGRIEELDIEMTCCSPYFSQRWQDLLADNVTNYLTQNLHYTQRKRLRLNRINVGFALHSKNINVVDALQPIDHSLSFFSYKLFVNLARFRLETASRLQF